MSAFGVVTRWTLRTTLRRVLFVVVFFLYTATSTLTMVKAPDEPGGPVRYLLLFAVFLLAAGIVGDETANGHIQLVAIRPVTRSSYLLGRVAGITAAVVLMALVGDLVACGIALAAGEKLPWAFLCVRAALRWLDLTGWIALLAAVSVVVTRLWNSVAVLISFFVWISVEEVLRQVGGPSLAARAGAIWAYLVPPSNESLVADLFDGVPANWSDVAYGFFYVAIALLVAALLLARKQLARRRT